jgi:Zn-dependent protease with chaperone function
MPVPVGAGGGGVDFAFDVPERARFQGDVGIFAVASTMGERHRRWGSTYSVSIVQGDTVEKVIEVPLPADRERVGDWQPIDLDLARWAGQRIVLRLQVVPEKAVNAVRIGWWGSPRIVVSDAAPRTR